MTGMCWPKNQPGRPTHASRAGQRHYRRDLDLERKGCAPPWEATPNRPRPQQSALHLDRTTPSRGGLPQRHHRSGYGPIVLQLAPHPTQQPKGASHPQGPDPPETRKGIHARQPSALVQRVKPRALVVRGGRKEVRDMPTPTLLHMLEELPPHHLVVGDDELRHSGRLDAKIATFPVARATPEAASSGRVRI